MLESASMSMEFHPNSTLWRWSTAREGLRLVHGRDAATLIANDLSWLKTWDNFFRQCTPIEETSDGLILVRGSVKVEMCDI